MLAADLVVQVVGDGELQEVTRNPLVPEDGPRVFDGGANVEVGAARIVRGNEIETAGVPVIHPGRVHEPAGTCRLERFRKLPDGKSPQVLRQRDQVVFLEKVDHLLLATLIGLEECRLIPGNVLAPPRIRGR